MYLRDLWNAHAGREFTIYELFNTGGMYIFSNKYDDQIDYEDALERFSIERLYNMKIASISVDERSGDSVTMIVYIDD